MMHIRIMALMITLFLPILAWSNDTTMRINNSINSHGVAQFYRACQKNNLDLIIDLIDQGIDIYKLDNYRWNGLHYACYSGHINIIKFLLQKCMNYEQKDIYNKTPFYYACLHNHTHIVEYFIEQGIADSGTKTQAEVIDLHIACQKPSQQIYSQCDIESNLVYPFKLILDQDEQEFLFLLTPDFDIDIIKVIFSKSHYKNLEKQLQVWRLSQTIAFQENNNAISMKNFEQASLIINDTASNQQAHYIFYFIPSALRYAYHEAGHALLCRKLDGGNLLSYISIQRAKITAGRTAWKPNATSLSLEQKFNRIIWMCGGCIGEQLFNFFELDECECPELGFQKFQTHFTTAKGDYARALKTAREYLQSLNSELYCDDMESLEQDALNVVKSSYKQAFCYLKNKKVELEIVANALFKIKFLTARQIQELID